METTGTLWVHGAFGIRVPAPLGPRGSHGLNSAVDDQAA